MFPMFHHLNVKNILLLLFTATFIQHTNNNDNNVSVFVSSFSPQIVLRPPSSQAHTQSTHKYTTIMKKKCSTACPSFTQLNAIEVPTLEDLDNDHEKEGSRMAKSIIGWLDQEWMPQEVHVQMANCAKESFVRARNDGETEIMNVMTIVVDDLVENWKQYDKDAFVNAWDIGNYVSDYLYARILDPEDSCGCSANIFNPDEE